MIRVGQGFDVHPFCENKVLYLGGVKLPYSLGLSGHSDGDVLIHAVADALLGAIAKQDIGHHFPPGDPETSGIDSKKILHYTQELLQESGWLICNIDCIVICEKPKIAPFREAMAATMAECLKIGADQIQVKGTTTEKLGFTGREEGIAAMATCLVMKS